jgi:hypothetical protein
MAQSENTPPPTADELENNDAPGAPSLPPEAGLVPEDTPDENERPQADPEVPELGSWDKQRGSLPENDATGF